MAGARGRDEEQAAPRIAGTRGGDGQAGRLVRVSLENDKALEAVKKQGLHMADMPGDETLKKYAVLGLAARKELAGKLFSKDLLDRVEGELAKLRARTAKKG